MRAAPESAPVGLRERGSQLVFLGGALECFRRVLDPVDDPVVPLDRHQANDLVLAARSIVLRRPFEIDRLADRKFMHSLTAGVTAIRAASRRGPLACAIRLGYIAYCGFHALFRVCPADQRQSRNEIGWFGPETNVCGPGFRNFQRPGALSLHAPA